MKNIVRVLVLGALAAAIAVPAAARNVMLHNFVAFQGGQDETEKNNLYAQFTAAYNKYKASRDAKSPTMNDDYKAAYDIAKQYVEKYGASNDDYAKYFRDKFIPNYDTYQKALRKSQVDQYINDKKYQDAFTLGRQILADEPNDEATIYKLAKAGIIAATTGNNSFNNDSMAYAKHAIELIEAGKFSPDTPDHQKKDMPLAILNYGLALFTVSSAPSETTGYVFKVVSYDSPLKSEASTYDLLRRAYEAEYIAVATDYKNKFPDATSQATPEGKAATDKVNGVTDRLIDAYARAIAYAGTDSKYAEAKSKWMDRLTELYKYRHDNSDAGLKEMISSITTKPLPTLSSTQPASSTTSSAQPSGTK